MTQNIMKEDFNIHILIHVNVLIITNATDYSTATFPFQKLRLKKKPYINKDTKSYLGKN